MESGLSSAPTRQQRAARMKRRDHPAGSFAFLILAQACQVAHIVKSVHHRAAFPEFHLGNGSQVSKEMTKGSRPGIKRLADKGLNRIDVAYYQHGFARKALL